MVSETTLAIAFVAMFAIAVNFLPSAVAFGRGHPDRKLLAQLNVLSLLSFLLWLALLVWAAGGTRNDVVINRFVHSKAARPLLVGLIVVLVGGGIAATALAVGLV